MSQTRHLQHVKSSQVEATGLPKMPVATDLYYGELAVNYANGLETLTLRNSSNQLVKFRPNTNVAVKNVDAAISDESLQAILNVSNVYSYQDFNITYLQKYCGNFDLSRLIKYIKDTFYDICDVRIMLNVAKGDDADGTHTSFIVNAETMQLIMNETEKPINKKSSIIGFTKYDTYFVAGDSTAMSGIELIWDNTTKAITIRFVYLDGVYRLNGEEI